MRVIQPYEDEKMTFNQDLNMYVLKIAEVKDKLEDTIQDDGKLTKRITKNSRTVYNYIHAIGHSANKPFVDFLISVDAEMSKVSWPTWPETLLNTKVLLVFMALFTILLFVYDLIFHQILSLYYKL